MARDKSIKIRLSEYEYKQLQQESEKQGVGMSDVLRKCIAKFPKPVGDFSRTLAFIRLSLDRRMKAADIVKTFRRNVSTTYQKRGAI